MADIRFVWNPAKAAANLKNHGVSFDEAKTAFEDDQALVIDDPDHSDAEDRFILLGIRQLLASSWSCTATGRQAMSFA